MRWLRVSKRGCENMLLCLHDAGDSMMLATR